MLCIFNAHGDVRQLTEMERNGLCFTIFYPIINIHQLVAGFVTVNVWT